MGKKKLSLKPVQRGFATTSLPTKKAKEEAAAAKAEKEAAVQEQEASKTAADESNASPIAVVSSSNANDAAPAPAGAKDAWDDDHAIETAVYQALVDRLQEKGEKEVTRVIKLVEYEKRFATTFPRLEINPKVRDEALLYAVQDYEDAEGTAVKGLEPSSSVVEEDKTLLRLFITRQVLLRIGFTEARVTQCILEGLEEGDGWSEGVEWVGEFANKSEELSETDSTLVDVAHVDVVESAAETPAPQTPAELDVKPANAAPVGSLFQSLGDESSDSESDSDADPDHNKDNETWANLMLELDTLKVAAGTVKGKKKGKANQVVMETPEMVKIKAKIAKVEKEYMFSRKDAGESP
ncbi:uncharacterized protein EHS24_005178 [Apiotrichum porosum]|uniref:Uncharacterized protein n=1 Tax=Apiotrichum porosum TaxID=105984 RepID=A0A427Y731_9TREE|nr:uncharacterized protein EHS24_005178 [Apiotrichum porosum]RSH86900.1 hypothetical protein EHS24_005178 [Apiotrichum porosum]